MTPAELLDRRVPDVTGSEGLTPELGAEIDWLAGRFAPWTSGEAPVDPGVRARALVQAGRAMEARQHLGNVGVGPTTTQGWVAAAWAVSRTGPAEVADRLMQRGPGGGERDGFLFQGDVPLGPRSLSVALLELARGNHDAAIGLLGEAVSVGDLRGPAWGARARLELGRVLGDGSGLDLDENARAVGRRARLSARTFFEASGYRHLAAVTERLIEPSSPTTGCDAPAIAEPWVGHLVPGPQWTVGFGVAPAVTLPASRGLVVVRELVRRGGEQVSAIELDRLEERPESIAGRPRRGPDREELETMIAEGATAGDLRERIFDERIRSRVSKSVRRTIERIESVHPLLGRHLRDTIGTGNYCGYTGPARIAWRLDGDAEVDADADPAER